VLSDIKPRAAAGLKWNLIQPHGPVGLALIVGSGNYLKPDVPLPEIPLAFVYLGCWFLMTGTVYYFFGLETRGKSIEQIDRELAVSA
jgi:putative MFS transporter